MADFLNTIGGFFVQIIDNLLNFLFDFLFVIVRLLFGWINIENTIFKYEIIFMCKNFQLV